MSDEFDLGGAGKELLSINKELSNLKAENARLKQVIKDNDLEEEIEDIDCTSLEEKICLDGIRYIAELVESQDFDKSDISNFDVLYRTLRSIRGKSASVPKKAKSTDLATLLKIAEGTK